MPEGHGRICRGSSAGTGSFSNSWTTASNPRKRSSRVPKNLPKELKVGLVATNDAHYIYQNQAMAHDALICIGRARSLMSRTACAIKAISITLKSAEEMKQLFKDVPQAIRSTVEISERCNLELDFHKIFLPHSRRRREDPDRVHGRTLLQVPARPLLGPIPANYETRLRTEIALINKMGYISYFLIVWISSGSPGRKTFRWGRAAGLRRGVSLRTRFTSRTSIPSSTALFRAVSQSRAREHAGYRYRLLL